MKTAFVVALAMLGPGIWQSQRSLRSPEISWDGKLPRQEATGPGKPGCPPGLSLTPAWRLSPLPGRLPISTPWGKPRALPITSPYSPNTPQGIPTMRFRDLFRSLFRRPCREALRPARRRAAPVRPQLEALEGRLLLSFSPLDVRHAYGFDRVGFLDSTHAYVPGDGRGTTIAIIEAYDDPNIATDLANFDALYGLPAPASFTRVNQRGGTALPNADPNQSANFTWTQETALDVEYAHAMAPGASILLVEADSSSFANLDTAVRVAAGRPGVVAVSMSFGRTEYDAGTGQDASLVHAGVTFVASTGDNGAPGHSYSPNVVAVGGTSLTLDAGGNYSSESGWSGGGGVSPALNQPAYQNGVVTQSSTRRCTPDVSFVADPATGVLINDTYTGSGFYVVGGTSASAPIMAGLVAVVNQGRSYLNGQPSYNGGDFLNALYKLPGNAFHDVTTGNNGFAAGTGYDLVTGRGTPNVPRFVAGLTGDPVLDPTTGTLLVVGGGRNSSDTLTVNTSGSQLQVTFNLSAPYRATAGGARTRGPTRAATPRSRSTPWTAAASRSST